MFYKIVVEKKRLPHFDLSKIEIHSSSHCSAVGLLIFYSYPALQIFPVFIHV